MIQHTFKSLKTIKSPTVCFSVSPRDVEMEAGSG